MKVELVQAERTDAERIHQMKYEAFWPLYERYRDDATSPAMEPIDKVVRQLSSPDTDYYLIQCDGEVVGAVRVANDGTVDGRRSHRISPLFILPEFQNRGIGCAALRALFARYPRSDVWRLSTIAQERGNCHLYEKCGFVRVDGETAVNARMTIVYYQTSPTL